MTFGITNRFISWSWELA